MPDDALKTAVAADCFHCGQPLGDAGEQWQVTISGAPRALCCPGCAAVAQAIVELGQESYYLKRDAFPERADAAALVPPELALYQNSDPRFGSDAESCSAVLTVEGIRCAACVWLIEQRLSRVPGVQSANLNVATERLHVRWGRDDCDAADILRAVGEVGYRAYPCDAARHAGQLQRNARTLGRQLFVAGLSMMQVMMYVAPEYLATDGTLDDSMAALMRWASLLLTLPAVVYSARPFFAGALASLRARALGMDVPVALGIVAAFGASVVATVRGTGEVYFDSVTMFIFLLLCSRFLELRVRRLAASALERMQQALPASATRLAGYPDRASAEMVSAAALLPGDVVLIKPGEAVPADCTVLEGESSVDLSLLSGESAPQARGVGNTVPGGAINVRAALTARVERAAADSTLAGLVRLVEQVSLEKPRMAQWADRVAGWFVAALLLLALACLGFWSWYDPARAWPVAIAVLVVSCPCALSLATPCALAAAGDRLLRQGVLVVGPHTLETLRRATHIVFDKTGTLTEGRPVMEMIKALGSRSPHDCLEIAAALEAHSNHPLARAVTEAAAEDATVSIAPALAIDECPGRGVEGRVQGLRYRLGSAAYIVQLLSQAGANAGLPAAPAGMTALYLASEHELLACLLLHDGVRPDAAATIDYFRAQGKTLVVLSGDDDALTRRVAASLGIEDARGGCLPETKLARVRQLQEAGAVVAMVGDGINDAAVLGAADVSFAMGAGAALAQAHADAVLLGGRIGALADAARMSQRTTRVIAQNLAWATLYNAVAIPAAAMGLLSPWLSGAGMAVSSAVVVLNALRLWKN